MYIYLLYYTDACFYGAYTELEHSYMRMLKVWLHLNSISDEEYYEQSQHMDKVGSDWILYKIPVGEHEDVLIHSISRGSQYIVELPETYGKLRCIIRDSKIKVLTE